MASSESIMLSRRYRVGVFKCERGGCEEGRSEGACWRWVRAERAF